MYHSIPINDVEAVPAEFSKSAQELLGPAMAEFTGEVSGLPVRLRIEPKYSEAYARYDQKKEIEDCTPILEVPVTPQVSFDNGQTIASGGGKIAWRHHRYLLGGLGFMTNSSEALKTMIPQEKRANAVAADLAVALENLDQDSILSNWTWTIWRDCAGCQSVETVLWGDATLKRAP